MAIISKLYYKPPIKRIEKEEDIKTLLFDVQHSLARIGLPGFEISSLRKILNIIDGNKFQKNDDPYFTTEVDLSIAKSMIDSYRNASEKGCPSCKRMGVHYPKFGGRMSYCNRYEDEKIAEESWNINNSRTPIISKYYESGCQDKEVIIRKTIEKIIEESEK